MKMLIIFLFVAGIIFLVMALMVPFPTSATIPVTLLDELPQTSEIAITIASENFDYTYDGETLKIENEKGTLTLYPNEFEDENNFDLFFENWVELPNNQYIEPTACNFIEIRLNNINEKKSQLNCFETINE